MFTIRPRLNAPEAHKLASLHIFDTPVKWISYFTGQVFNGAGPGEMLRRTCPPTEGAQVTFGEWVHTCSSWCARKSWVDKA